jgi:uncharacterized membrane protein/thiol-disulfide isomerase/thioredoxin
MIRGWLWAAIVAGLVAAPGPWSVQAGRSVVRAVLFYSPTCPHCYKVITESLPPIIEEYGDRLEIIGVNTSSPGGQALFQAAIERLGIPVERQGVPMLIVDDVVLVGSVEIPAQLPACIEHYLAQGGVDWPDIPGLADALAAAQPTPSASPALQPTASEPVSTPSPQPTMATIPESASQGPAATSPLLGVPEQPEPSADLRARLTRDPVGSTLAVMVLLWMILIVGRVVAHLVERRHRPRPSWHERSIPWLSLAGMGIAGYLAYVEATRVLAVCGPIGDCNTVQQSDYARLFGLFPIGAVGFVGYAAIAVTWLARRVWRGRPAVLLGRTLFAMTLLGTLFSIYLTFLEPFVIGATCAWCLASAVTMTGLLWLTPAPESRAAARAAAG